MSIIMKSNHLLRTIRFVWHKGKGWIFFSIFFAIVSGLIPIATVWISKELVNSVADLIQHRSSNFRLTFLLLIVQFLIMLTDSSIQGLKRYFDKKMQITLEHDLKRIITEKTSSVPFAYFDIPDFYNHLNRIKESPGSKFLAPIKDFLSICSSIISMVSFLVFLLTIHWSLVVLSVVVGIPIFIIKSIYGNKQFWLKILQSPVSREAQYLEHLLNDRQTAKELRLFNLPSHLLRRWSNRFMKNANQSLALLRKQQVAEISLDGLTALFYVGASSIIIWLIRTTDIRVGDFVAIGQAVSGTQEAIDQISTKSAEVYENNLYIKDFYYFLDFNEPDVKKMKGTDPFPHPLQKSIEFDDVSFRYIYGTADVLKNVSLTIYPGEKIAIVGDNGSGKTSLVKCLLGLYTPTKGHVLFDGKSTDDIDPKELRNNITVIFQDFMRYSLSVRENIGFGNLSHLNNDSKIRDVAQQSNVHEFVNKFKDKYDTYLGRFLKDGEDLSGGQWQKVALARALIRESEIVVFDEPTASLDPQSELEVFSKFRSLSANKTALFISHRMAAARMSDRIIVMKEGKVKELGTHEELMQLDGEYARMYQIQAQWYCNSEIKEHVNE